LSLSLRREAAAAREGFFEKLDRLVKGGGARYLDSFDLIAGAIDSFLTGAQLSIVCKRHLMKIMVLNYY
jgi:hypothetical protein